MPSIDRDLLIELTDVEIDMVAGGVVSGSFTAGFTGGGNGFTLGSNNTQGSFTGTNAASGPMNTSSSGTFTGVTGSGAQWVVFTS